MELRGTTYYIQDIRADHLCEEFGTPLYVYDADKIVGQIQRLGKAFAGTQTKIKFAAKALTNLSILDLMRRHGTGVDTVSIEEARLALRAGFAPHEITYTPSGVSFEELRGAVDLGLLVTLDNLSILEQFGNYYKESVPCSLRLNPNIMAGGNRKIATGHGQAKFGIAIEQLETVRAQVRKYHLQIAGLHIHTGSEIGDPVVFRRMADLFFSIAGHFPDLRFLDFGGGFKVPYSEDDTETDVEAVGRELVTAFNAFCKQRGQPLELWLEPGKFLVSEAGVLLARVNVVKETSSITFAGLNTGLNHLIRPMMYDAYHHIVNISNPHGPEKRYDVVGYICETDTLGENRLLHEVREGDILAVLNAGAYGYSMASNYNSRLRPAEVLVEEGKARLIRARETFDDLLRHQQI